MFAHRNPQETYRRIEFDARVEASSPAQLVTLCYEQACDAMASALFAHDSGNNLAKSQAITKALAAITALQLGVNGEEGVSAALRQFYASVRRALLDCALKFDAETIAAMRRDLHEIAGALTSDKTNS